MYDSDQIWQSRIIYVQDLRPESKIIQVKIKVWLLVARQNWKWKMNLTKNDDAHARVRTYTFVYDPLVIHELYYQIYSKKYIIKLVIHE